MSEPSAIVHPEADETPQINPPAYEVDQVLDELVHYANLASGAQWLVTLVVGGALISGTLIGTAEFAAAHAEMWGKSTFPDGTPNPLRLKWDAIAATVREKYAVASTKAVAAGQLYRPRFIHLKNARVVSASGSVPTPPGGLLWRGKLSQVQGFSVGGLDAKRA